MLKVFHIIVNKKLHMTKILVIIINEMLHKVDCLRPCVYLEIFELIVSISWQFKPIEIGYFQV